MKRLLMKSGLVGIVLGVGLGFGAANPCVSDVSSYQLRSLGRAEAHQIGATLSGIPAGPSDPAARADVFRLRSYGRSEAGRISLFTAKEPAPLADNGGAYLLRALGRGEARVIGTMNCDGASHPSQMIGQR